MPCETVRKPVCCQLVVGPRALPAVARLLLLPRLLPLPLCMPPQHRRLFTQLCGFPHTFCKLRVQHTGLATACAPWPAPTQETLDPSRQKQGDTKEGFYFGREVAPGSAEAALPLHGPNQVQQAKLRVQEATSACVPRTLAHTRTHVLALAWTCCIRVAELARCGGILLKMRGASAAGAGTRVLVAGLQAPRSCLYWRPLILWLPWLA